MSTFRDPPLCPPLLRHAALRPFSREHMRGLIVARDLQAAASQRQRTDAVVEFVSAWRSEIERHFADEERLLLPLIASAALRHRLTTEHALIRAEASRCLNAPNVFATDPQAVTSLGRLLCEHIRWEERTLFEATQRDHRPALDSMLGDAAAIESARPGSRPRLRLDRSTGGETCS